jgi:hypothetical protein
MTRDESLHSVFREVARLSSDELRARLVTLVERDRHVTAELLVHLGEVDARRLHVSWAFSSLFGYAVESLGFSEDEAYKRITAARTARRFPAALELIHGGRLHLSGLLVVAPYLTAQNHSELLGAACGKSKRQVEQLVAECFPRPDVASSVRKLPAASSEAAGTDATSRKASSDSSRAAQIVRSATSGAATQLARSVTSTDGSTEMAPGGAHCQALSKETSVPQAAEATTDAAPIAVVRPAAEAGTAANARTVAETAPRPADGAGSGPGPMDPLFERPPASNGGEALPTQEPAPTIPTRPADRPRVEPLAPSRYRVTFTASAELVHKLERAQELASHAVSPSDIAAVFERALDALIAHEQKRRYATKPPQPASNDGARPTSVGAASDDLAPERVREPHRAPPHPASDALAPERPVGPQRTSAQDSAQLAPERVNAATGASNENAARDPTGYGPPSRYVPARVRRAVCERDGERCTFVDPATGRRCSERRFLEFEHIEPYALGGPATADNLTLVCGAHNALFARRAFGERYVEAAVARARGARTLRSDG